jgi:response regulator of citrate/malate metabolism
MSTKNRSEIRLGTIVRALLGSALIGTLGFLWILQSRAHQRLQDQISQIRSQCTVLERSIGRDQQEIEKLLTRPALIRRIQELRLGLTNIAYRQVIHVTNQAPGSTPSLELSRNNTHPTAPAPPIAVAIPR